MNKNSYSEKLNILDIFVMSSVCTILGIRLFLELTGYPQIGGNGLHIAHMLWGGLALTATTLYTLLANSPHRYITALAGGIGFGFFIDEIGKFVTSDNNYFFQPSAFLIYVIILSIWLFIRFALIKIYGGSFLSPVAWPRNKLLSYSILIYGAIQIVIAFITAVGLVFEGANILGIVSGLKDITLYIYFAIGIIFAIGLWQYKNGERKLSANTLRTGSLMNAVLIQPFVFYNEQFTAAIGFLITVAVIFGLSEASIKKLLLSSIGK